MHLPRFGRAKKPVDQATINPLMQAHMDTSLPFWVASDHAIWGTFDGMHDAARLADRIAENEPSGERIMVTLNGVSVYTVRGESRTKHMATKR
jgi:hypothetical protein